MYNEQDICSLYLNKISVSKIKKLTKFSVDKIIKILLDNDIKVKYGKKIPEDIKNKIIQLYQNGFGYKKIQKELTNILKLNQSDIFKCLREEKINIHTQRIYNIDENCFEDINHNNSHILGLFYSDGWLNKNISVNIGLAEQDYNVLENLKIILKSDYPLYLTSKSGSDVKLPDGSVVKRKQSIYRLTIQHPKIIQDLLKLGLTQRKSWNNFGLPNIPKQFLNSFILGYFEGDGWLSIYQDKTKKNKSIKWGILGQENFISELQKFLLKELNVELVIEKVPKKRESHNQLYALTTCKLSNLIKIYKWLYKDASFAMIRKHKKWEDALNDIKTRPRKYEECDLYTFNDKGVRINC